MPAMVMQWLSISCSGNVPGTVAEELELVVERLLLELTDQQHTGRRRLLKGAG